MINKWSKLLPILLALTLVLAGCGSKGNQETSNGTSSDVKPGKEVTITFWHHYSTASPEEKTLKEVLIPKFEQENPGIKVNPVAFTWEDLHKKLQISGSAGDLPDVARLDIIWVPEFQKSGMLQQLDAFEDFDEVAGSLLEGPLSTAKVGDHYYGLPLNTNTKVLFWNKEMLSQSGVEQAPQTTEQFFEALGKIKSKYEKSWGFGEPALQGWNVLPWIWSNGGDVLSPDFTTADGYLNSPASVEILTKLKNAYNAGQISGFKPGDVAVTEGHASGSYAMMAEGPWAVAQFQSQFPDFEVEMTSFPAGSAGSIQVLGGEDIGIFSQDKQEESWKFVKFMVSEAAQIEMGKIGQIPVNLASMENADVKAIDYYPPFLEQLKTAKARPPVSAWPQIDGVINDAMSKIFMTNADVKTELDAAVVAIDALLKE
ncbi:extracellular solute-binding protein [Paenibacillus barengoltzii]|jgi:multiple sugar transport system substrate-binding protein|uniref:extracellular solute-binding protein n=1 Tax=Paenibacillus barengoltzii TaxID=343517 RepID=UPI000FDB6DFD|nr:extracellular solute-binding protein [Paenibacillus barengoltzii]MEC2346528.1 extracellular solute-binding protein [Paenibacillus barengoltzii]